jgi:copper chaperone NosL
MKVIPIVIWMMTAACANASWGPASIRLREDACAHCRMTLLSLATAAQIVSPQEEPVIFDDVGCLREYLQRHALADGARVFVADHRSLEWIDASTAVFTQSTVHTPMSSGVLAHANAASRDADPEARGGDQVRVLP